MVENVLRYKLGTLHSNKGVEHMSKTINTFMAKRGIEHQCSVPYTLKKFDIVERKWKWHNVWLRVNNCHTLYGLHCHGHNLCT